MREDMKQGDKDARMRRGRFGVTIRSFTLDMLNL
jgi:hypothetical protein